MNKKLAVAAVVIALAGALVTAPAEAQRRHHRGGGGSAAAAGIAGFAAGALLGGAIASQPRYGYGAATMSRAMLTYLDPLTARMTPKLIACSGSNHTTHVRARISAMTDTGIPAPEPT